MIAPHASYSQVGTCKYKQIKCKAELRDGHRRDDLKFVRKLDAWLTGSGGTLWRAQNLR